MIIIASGPSLTKEDVNYIKGKGFVIAINDNYLMAPWAGILYFCDPKWLSWHINKHEFKSFKGEVVTQDKPSADKHGFKHVKSLESEGFSTTPGVIHQGQNSGYQAVNLAMLEGAKRIILLGFDHQINGKTHWFGDHPDKVRSSYNVWMAGWEKGAKHAIKLGVDIVNCSPETALTCFPRKRLDQVL